MKKTKLFSLLVLLSCLFVSSNNGLIQQTDKEINERILVDSEKYENNMSDMLSYAPTGNIGEVKCIDSERSFDTTVEEFVFTSSTLVDEVKYEGDFSLFRYEIYEESVSCLITDFINEGNIKLTFLQESTIVDTCVIYVVKDSSDKFCSSVLSLDTAKRNAGKELNYSLSDTYEQEGDSENLGPITRAIGVVGSVSGTLKWKDEQGNDHPLIGAKISVTIAGSWWSGHTYTNQTGYYSISYYDIWYLGSGKPMVHIYTDGESVKVHNGGTYEKKHEFNGSSGDWVYSYTFSPITDGDMGKAMMIFQGGKNFADYAEYMNGGSPISFCNIKYPSGSSGAYYSGGTIHLSSETPSRPGLPEMYASWDILGHEYGHHVQNVFNISANPGGKHTIPGNNIDDQYSAGYSLSQAKDRGHKLSWGEGWPTYWSTVAQTHFSTDLRSINTVGDTYYTATNGPNYDLDYSYYGSGYGDADEQAIQRILFKLYSSKTDSHDKFALGEYTLWNIIVSNKPHTLYEFIEDLYNNGYNKSDLGLLLSGYRVIASAMTISNAYFDTRPTFTWSTYMGSNNLRYNQFDLYIENLSGGLIRKISNIGASSSNCSYTISSADWQSIYSSTGNQFVAYFVARQTDYYTSGNYYSEKFFFNKPSTYSNSKIQMKPNEWGFEGRYYFPNEIENDPSVRFSTHAENGLIISTDRLRCGYIENSYINLSPRRAGAGRAYFEMNFNTPVYSFLYSVCLWSSSENLDGLALLQIKDANGNWSILTNLKTDITLTTKEQGLKRYSHYFAGGIYGIKFETTATATGSSNKGRLSIDDIALSTNSGVSNNTYSITTYPKTNP